MTSSSTSSSQQLSAEIDRLLESYLSLLDQYTLLRSQLSAAQVSTQQHLARAKFHAPPGVSYGEAMYDGRMRAGRRCAIADDGTFSVLKPDENQKAGDGDKNPAAEKEEDTPEQKDENENPNPTPHSKSRDPILMFGLLTPSSLRQAQTTSIEMVENIMPEICRLDREMGEIEIKIRRARKFRGKTEEREVKEGNIGESVLNVAGLSIEV